MNLITATYLAHKEAEFNEQVIATIAAGQPNVTIFLPNTPSYVVRYLVSVGNEKNRVASATSHVEKIKFVGKMKKCMDANLNAKGIKTRDEHGSQKGYDPARREWVRSHPRNGM